MSKLEEAIQVLEGVQAESEVHVPVNVKRMQATQLAEAYRRYGEQLVSLGKSTEAFDMLTKGIGSLDEAMQEVGADGVAAFCAVKMVGDALAVASGSLFSTSQIELCAQSWDANPTFIGSALGHWETTKRFERNSKLQRVFPTLWRSIEERYSYALPESSDPRLVDETRCIGKVARMFAKNFGFIDCSEYGDVHFNSESLEDRTQWPKLKPGVEVAFNVVLMQRGPRAVGLILG
jgi:cold shock CspA family protein